MKLDKFTTEVYKGHCDINDKIIKDYNEWYDFEKTLDTLGCQGTTTVNGWQFSFNTREKSPPWLESCNVYLGQIKKEVGLSNTKSLWTIFYETGGYQDPHFHQPDRNLYTIIFNLIGKGELALFDPRPLATAHGNSIVEKIMLEPGDWIALPSWLVHSSSPCKEKRAILVIDIYK